MVARFGMSPMKFLKTEDSFERSTMQAVANAAHKLEQDQDLARAQMIAYEVGKMMGVVK